MPANNALVLVFERNAFYKRLHYLALAALSLTILAIAILITILVFILKNPLKPLYFATDNVGRLIPVIPVGVPNMSIDEVMAWTIEAIQNAFSYDFINYRAQFQTSQKYFTTYGWNNYMHALTYSNNLPALTARQWVILAQVTEKPKIVKEGIMPTGAFAWQFQIPLLVSYLQPPLYDDKTKFVNPYVLSVLVQRQPILQSYRGLGILQVIATFNVTPANPPPASGTPPR